jgi:CBS domain-containing protein
MKTNIMVADAMTTKPVTCKPDLSLIHVANLMADENVGSVIITEKNEVVGIITETDFVQKIAAGKVDVESAKVKDYMSQALVTIPPNIDIMDAMGVMRKQEFRRLPVVENGKLAGMITIKDVLRIQPQLYELMAEMMNIREAHRKPIAKLEEVDELTMHSQTNLDETDEQ